MKKNNPIEAIIDTRKVILDLPSDKSSSLLEVLKYAAGLPADVSKLRFRNSLGKLLEASSVAGMSVSAVYEKQIRFAPKPTEEEEYFYVCITDNECDFDYSNFTSKYSDAAYFVNDGDKVTAVFLCSGGDLGFNAIKKCVASQRYRYEIRVSRHIRLMASEVYIYRMPAAVNQFKMAAIMGCDSWLDPLPFLPRRTGVMQLNVDLMPARLFHFCMALAHSTGKTVDYIWAATVCVLGAVISGKIRIAEDERQLKPYVSLIWTVVVGAPGAGKTPSINTVLELMKTYFVSSAEASTSSANARALKTLELAKNQEVSKKIKERHKMGEKINLPEINRSVEKSFHVELVDSSVDLRGLVLATDVTLAGLYKLLESALGPVLYFADELKSLLMTLDHPDSAKLRAQFLQAESGNNAIVVARGNQETRTISDAALCLLSGIQPDAFAPFIRAALNGDVTNDGLLNRLQIIVLNATPKSVPENSSFAKISVESMKRFFGVLKNTDFGFDPKIALSERKVMFSEQAHIKFQEWNAKNQSSIEATKSNQLLQSQLSKYPALVCKLSLIYQVIMSFDPDTLTLQPINSVGLESLQYAERTLDYLYSHAKTVFSNDGDSLHELAKVLFERLKQLENLDEFTASEIAQKNWRLLNRDTDLVNRLLVYLEEFGLVRSRKAEKTVFWSLHPLANHMDY